MRRYEKMDDRTAQEYLERYVASLPELRARFARRLDRTGGPVVDTSVAAVGLLDPWYERQIQDPSPDGQDGVPLWWDREVPGPEPLDNQLRLVDEVGAHLAGVLQQAVPDAEWVVLKQRGGSRTSGHQRTVLRMGPSQPQPWHLAYSHLASILGGRSLRPNLLQTKVANVLRKAGVEVG